MHKYIEEINKRAVEIQKTSTAKNCNWSYEKCKDIAIVEKIKEIENKKEGKK